MSCYRIDGFDLIVGIKVQPNAQKNEIVGVRNSEVLIKINAQTEGGKANKKVVEFLAKEFKIPKQSVLIRQGELNRHKVLVLPCDVQITQFLNSLKRI